MWKNYDELVTWATWRIMEGLTKGEPLRSLIAMVLSTARTAEFEPGAASTFVPLKAKKERKNEPL